MVKITKVYTRTGDGGQTKLGNGDTVNKPCRRITALGDIDELNASIGWAIRYTANEKGVTQILTRVQNDLFDLGASVCTPTPATNISDEQVDFIEKQIDALNTLLRPLDSFILPGGSDASAALHLARTVCRRAERSLIALHEETQIRPSNFIYLNRLSDLLFVMCRICNLKEDGSTDVLWVPGLFTECQSATDHAQELGQVGGVEIAAVQEAEANL